MSTEHNMATVLAEEMCANSNSRLLRQNVFLNNQPDALIITIYSVIKLYMFRASSLPIVRSFLLYIRHW
jgi:hypothetical protein